MKIEELKELEQIASEAPWCWGMTMKEGGYNIGAGDIDGVPVAGEIDNDALMEIYIARAWIGGSEMNCNYNDARLIVALRNHAATLIEVVEAAKKVSDILQPGAQRFGLVDAHRELRTAISKLENNSK